MKRIPKSILYLLGIALLYLITLTTTFPQSRDYGTKFGAQLNGLYGLNDFDNSNSTKIGYLGRAFLRFELTHVLETEIGGGYGIMHGEDFLNNYYQTELIPLDLRFIIRPFNSGSFNPYFYAGIGALKFSVNNLPLSVSPNKVEADGWTGIVPVGLGFEIGLSESIILDISGGVTYSFSDDLNYFSRGAKDAYATLGIGLTFVGGAGSSDKDMDGLTKSEEKVYGTNPEVSDTDNDGVNDGDEIFIKKTDPLSSDTDKDGLSDGEEINKYLTDPLKADSDGDGLNDSSELNEYGSEPTKSDTDSDGIKDGEEINTYNTNPSNYDSDDDGLSDSDEINKYKTNPIKSDSDGDGLKDGDEVLKYKSNAMKIDSDGGTVSDRIEVLRGTDPNDSKDDVVKVNAPMVLEGVTFASGKYNITPESEAILSQALKTLRTYKDIIVEIRGYTDNVGKKSSNVKLSQRRANSVRNFLISKGIDGNRIKAVGYGPANPIVPNNSPENRRKNRRIEFVRIK